MKKSIPVTRSYVPTFEKYTEEIKDLWDSRWLTNRGEKHQQLEEELKKYLKVPHFSLFTNGHLALECALMAFDLSGDVITTPFTFASTTHAIVRAGLKPVFCDIDPDDFTIDVKKAASLITEKTTAIVPVHVYGHLCQVKEIEELADQYSLKVIYDAAHCFGVSLDGTGAGNFGDASMFSFHATKVFHTIEGGGVSTPHKQIKEKMDRWKNFGIVSEEEVAYAGGNAKMSEFQAAMGLLTLPMVEEEREKRAEVVKRYRTHLQGVRGIELANEQPGVDSNYAYFPVVFDGVHFDRDQVIESLKEENIYARKYFYPPTNEFDCYRALKPEKTPTAAKIARQVLTLPLYGELTLSDVDRICRIVISSSKKR